jgi:Fur family transcriptional regulator, ferric uptake regulator
MSEGRSTRQRAAIRAVFDDTRRPMGPQEVLKAAQKRVPGLSLATVYRTLNKLVEEQWLVAVELPGEPPRYEHRDLDHHHHFVCGSCHRAFDLEGCLPEVDALVPKGFTVERHELVFYGTCEKCSGGEEAPRKRVGHAHGHGQEHGHGHHHDHAHD